MGVVGAGELFSRMFVEGEGATRRCEALLGVRLPFGALFFRLPVEGSCH